MLNKFAAVGVLIALGATPVLAGATVVELSPDQQVEIHKDITGIQVAPLTSPDFEVTVGSVVPKTVELHQLPDTVIKLAPDYSHDEFFTLDDGRIAIVDPDSLEIVAIIDAE
jgi:hypothetical protein